MKIKRHLVLEYRIRKLEKAILEDMDSDLARCLMIYLKELRNTNVLIANQMVSALRKKIKELESELKDIKIENSLRV